MATWIDFKRLREQLRFADVLAHYGVQLKVKGDRASGFCPLPSHNAGKSPDRKRSPSFSANLTRGIWQCFGCNAKGNMLDFAAHMEGLDPHQGGAIRKVALILERQFLSDGGSRNRNRGDRGQHTCRPVSRSCGVRPVRDDSPKNATASHCVADDDVPVLVNQPLDFTLRDLDPGHPYLDDRGFTRETIEHFGLGFCHRGLLKDRIAIPVHNGCGDLIAYAGRIIDDDRIGEDCPKYLFPGTRLRKEGRYEFHKSLVVYNLHTIKVSVEDLIVVEGFASVWWLWQHGFASAVALMGSSCSDEQASALKERVAPCGRLWVMTDGDDAGVKCAAEVFLKCANFGPVRYVKLQPGEQPTDCTSEELASMLWLEPQPGAEKSGTST